MTHLGRARCGQAGRGMWVGASDDAVWICVCVYGVDRAHTNVTAKKRVSLSELQGVRSIHDSVEIQYGFRVHIRSKTKPPACIYNTHHTVLQYILYTSESLKKRQPETFLEHVNHIFSLRLCWLSSSPTLHLKTLATTLSTTLRHRGHISVCNLMDATHSAHMHWCPHGARICVGAPSKHMTHSVSLSKE